jgi:hypothetical protein
MDMSNERRDVLMEDKERKRRDKQENGYMK